MSKTKIGWIGLGNMGSPMVEQLIKADYQLIVYNRSKNKQTALKALGAEIADSPQEVAGEADIIFVMVSDDDALNSIFRDESGILKAELKDKIIVNMSTVSPGISKNLYQRCKDLDCQYLDAPVSGSVKQAETGQLVIMVGGEEGAFQKLQPIFSVLGKSSKLVGASGAGNNAKLAINSLLALYAQGLAETILFANQNGVKSEDLLELIGNAAIGNIFTTIKGNAILTDNYQAAFALKHIVKDLRLAKQEGISTPLALTTLSSFEKAQEKFAEEDIIAIIKDLR